MSICAEKFFYAHAGYSYDPKTETETEGHIKCARALAKAEREAHVKGFTYRWSIDESSDSSDWDDEKPAYQVWQCAMYNRDFRIVNSLHGIDFGRGGQPWGSEYERVVEAELAIDGLTNEPQGRG